MQMVLIFSESLQLGLSLVLFVLLDLSLDLPEFLHLGHRLLSNDFFFHSVLSILVKFSFQFQLLPCVSSSLLNSFISVVFNFLVVVSQGSFLGKGHFLRAIKVFLNGLLSLVVLLSKGVRFVNFGTVNVGEHIFIIKIF